MGSIMSGIPGLPKNGDIFGKVIGDPQRDLKIVTQVPLSDGWYNAVNTQMKAQNLRFMQDPATVTPAPTTGASTQAAAPDGTSPPKVQGLSGPAAIAPVAPAANTPKTYLGGGDVLDDKSTLLQ